jgi:hypothetical protein
MIALHHDGVDRKSSAGLPAILCGGMDSWEEPARRFLTAEQGSDHHR